MDRTLQFREAGYIVTCPLNSGEKLAAYRLRGDVFRRELRWSGNPCDLLDTDEFDHAAAHIAVLSPQQTIIGTLRVIGSAYPWMLDTCFSHLVPPAHILLREANTCEISRLAIVRTERARPITSGVTIADLLYKGLFLYCHAQGIRYGYMVVSRGALKHLRARGLPCVQAGQFTRMPDGVSAVLARLDWVEFLSHAQRHHPALLRWYLQHDGTTACGTIAEAPLRAGKLHSQPLHEPT